ncbi:VWA domain-containing protein [Pseudohaliea rubra]|uniref:VWFA domain-containing protein n=1 Tax=Pseudohaliea rubra DSM 19751 TaxID=1265313 RepID=A0A095VT42_9GAMM|nr:VWA domain-containing protein [Pseudohaliea rubra]KGE04258.1 hypothetical protein HRUBRA_01122 [Pseudohaliea rubra DSM 19751]
MLVLDLPWALLLLPLPWLLRRLLPPTGGGPAALQVPFLDRLRRLDRGRGAVLPEESRRDVLLPALAWISLVLAAAGPVRLEDPVTVEAPARDLLLAVDLSGSMATEDFNDGAGAPASRLTVVRELLAAFLERRDGDRIGLILFGSAPFVQLPFTRDRAVMESMLDEMVVGMAGPRTMLGDALGLAAKVFEESELGERVLILLTDGNDTGSRVAPREAARLCADRDIRVFTIGAGDPAAVGEESLDEATLAAVAETTGGAYFRAGDRAELEAVYTTIDRQVPRAVAVTRYRPRQPLFILPLAVAWLCMLALYPWRPGRGGRHG